MSCTPKKRAIVVLRSNSIADKFSREITVEDIHSVSKELQFDIVDEGEQKQIAQPSVKISQKPLR